MQKAQTFEIRNKMGLHARPAAKLVSIANQFKAAIFFGRDGNEVDGKSLLSTLTLACPQGSMMTIRAEGADAREALEALGNLIEDKFGED